MNLEKFIFGFLILLAATLNFAFFIGDIATPELRSVYGLAAALIAAACPRRSGTTASTLRRRQPCGKP